MLSLLRCTPGGRFGSIVSKKVFCAGELNFSTLLVQAARADVRDHVESQEGDHRASCASDRGLQKRRQAKTFFREIWSAAQFSTFSTASVKNGRGRSSNRAAEERPLNLQKPTFELPRFQVTTSPHMRSGFAPLPGRPVRETLEQEGRLLSRRARSPRMRRPGGRPTDTAKRRTLTGEPGA
jgi:hypothetical protein